MCRPVNQNLDQSGVAHRDSVQMLDGNQFAPLPNVVENFETRHPPSSDVKRLLDRQMPRETAYCPFNPDLRPDKPNGSHAPRRQNQEGFHLSTGHPRAPADPGERAASPSKGHASRLEAVATHRENRDHESGVRAARHMKY